MKIHIVKARYYDEGVPYDGLTYCGITGDYSERLDGCFVDVKNVELATCLKCIKSFNKKNANCI